MTTQLKRPAIDIYEELTKARVNDKHEAAQFMFTGNASLTAFALPNGWKPLMVFGTAGDIQLEGSGDDYTVAESFGVYTVTFAVAPSAADFTIIGEKA